MKKHNSKEQDSCDRNEGGEGTISSASEYFQASNPAVPKQYFINRKL